MIGKVKSEYVEHLSSIVSDVNRVEILFHVDKLGYSRYIIRAPKWEGSTNPLKSNYSSFIEYADKSMSEEYGSTIKGTYWVHTNKISIIHDFSTNKGASNLLVNEY